MASGSWCSMSPDEQEAQSRKYGRDVIVLLPLRSGRVAVLNAARELCGYVSIELNEFWTEEKLDWIELRSVWRAPALRIESYRTMKEEDADELLREAGL
jgi:hypothetical protein